MKHRLCRPCMCQQCPLTRLRWCYSKPWRDLTSSTAISCRAVPCNQRPPLFPDLAKWLWNFDHPLFSLWSPLLSAHADMSNITCSPRQTQLFQLPVNQFPDHLAKWCNRTNYKTSRSKKRLASGFIKANSRRARTPSSQETPIIANSFTNRRLHKCKRWLLQ
jgi:hypothetical protein